MTIARLSLLTLCLATGCATTGAEAGGERPVSRPKPDTLAAKVAHQAAFDLQCGQAELQVVKISDDMAFMGARMNTYGVRGCGLKATYKASCSLGMCSVFNEAQARGITPHR